MAAAVDDIVTFIFTSEVERDMLGYYIIPQNVTHLIFHESVTVIPAYSFYEHPNIVELYCHVGVKKIETMAFHGCPRLRRLIIPGVEVVESFAFWGCEAVADIECPKLERIGGCAFQNCKSLRNINLPSATAVERFAFDDCPALTDVKFGEGLESIGRGAFWKCPSLESITIPLKNGLFTNDDIFTGCGNLKSVDVAEGEELHDTIDTLLLEEWRNDMNTEMYSISQILPNARAGDENDVGEKTWAIRDWIERVLRKIIYYKAQHRFLLSEAMSALQLTALPNDIVINNVLPFLELPEHMFEGEG